MIGYEHPRAIVDQASAHEVLLNNGEVVGNLDDEGTVLLYCGYALSKKGERVLNVFEHVVEPDDVVSVMRRNELVELNDQIAGPCEMCNLRVLRRNTGN